MAVYATVADLQDRYEGTIPEDAHTRLEVKLVEAENLIVKLLGGPAALAARLARGAVTVDDLRTVECDMVLRLHRNPSGVTNQGAGPFTTGFNPTVASGNLWLTRENRALLGLRRSGAQSAEVVDDALRFPVKRRWAVDEPWRGNASHPEEDWYW